MQITSNYFNCSRRNPKRSAQCVYHIGISLYSTAGAGISCVKRKDPIKNSSIIRRIFFQSLSMASRREDLMDIDMVKSWETILRLTKLKKKCKMMDSKESMTDLYENQNSLIEWLKIIETKIFCRRWDALADEDHTHHVTAQEYFHYKNKWWLHSNKQGLNTMPLRHRSDFKQALLTLQRLQQAGEEPRVPTYSYKHEQWEARSSSSTWWNWKGSWWTPHHSESQEGGEPRDEWTERLVACSMWENSSGKDFQTSVYCDRRVVVWTQHLKWPVFEMQKCAVIWNRKIYDHRIQSGYKYPSELQNQEICTWYYVCVVTPGTTPMTTWPSGPRTHSTQRTWTLSRKCAVLLLVRFVSSWFTLHRMVQGCCACHLIHACDERFSSTLSPPFSSLIFPFIFYLLHFLPHFFHFLEGRSEPEHSA